MFTVGAFGIIFDERKRVLLCHRRDVDLWDLPGGRVELAETPWDGVVREVKEETGVDVEVDRLVGIYCKKKKNDLIFAFTCKVIGGKLSESDESDQSDYFSVNGLPVNLSPKQIERIIDAVSGRSTVYMKVVSDASGWELVQEILKKTNKKI